LGQATTLGFCAGVGVRGFRETAHARVALLAGEAFIALRSLTTELGEGTAIRMIFAGSAHASGRALASGATGFVCSTGATFVIRSGSAAFGFCSA
jgi:hypothetical protein